MPNLELILETTEDWDKLTESEVAALSTKYLKSTLKGLYNTYEGSWPGWDITGLVEGITEELKSRGATITVTVEFGS